MDKEILFNNIKCANLSSIDCEDIVERILQLKRREILEKVHKSKISYNTKECHWYTRLDGKKVKRKNLNDLEDVIVEYYNQKQLTLLSIFDEFMERRKLEVSPRTWMKDIRYYEKFLKDSSLAKIPIDAITLNDGYIFVKECISRKPDMKKKYWNNINGFLNKLIQYVIDMNYRSTNPFVHLKPMNDLFSQSSKTRDGDTVFSRNEQLSVISFAEKDALLANTSEPLGIVLLFMIGIRDGEPCALKWKDVEDSITGKYIHIQRELVADIKDDGKARGNIILEHCKTPAGDRRLLLNNKAVELLKQIKELNNQKGIPTELDNFIFTRKYKNQFTFCTPRCFDPRLRRYCKEAGMQVIKSPHDVRRTVLTNLYMAGMPLKKIQEFAGHTSLKQTMDYIRITDDDLNIMKYLNTLSDESLENVTAFRKQS